MMKQIITIIKITVMFLIALCCFKQAYPQVAIISYIYDSVGRVTNVTINGETNIIYSFDELGNRIEQVVTNSDSKTLELKVILEGPFNGSSMDTYINSGGFIPLNQPYNTSPWNYNGTESVTSIPNNNIVDWVLVELRETTGGASTATSDSIIAQKAGFILNDGSIVDRDGYNPIQIDTEINNNLYVVIWHKNHIGVMSAYPLLEVDGVYSYDFTSSIEQAYGINAQKELAPGMWGMIAADGNADGIINNLDKENVWEPQAGESGYKTGDYNMDTEVDNKDKNDNLIPNEGNESEIPE